MKRLTSLISLLVVCLVNLTAQTARTFTVDLTNLYPIAGSDEKATLTVFLPENPTGRAVVACPGGGYQHLAMEHEGTSWAPFFNSQGIALAVLKYRMPHGNRMIPMSDAQNAIKTVRDSAKTWNINPNDVGIMGSSAGGHLAAITSTKAAFATRPNFTILFYPVISMNERETHSGSVNNFLGNEKNDKNIVEQFSAERQVRRHLTPPAIIMLANDDRVVAPVTNGIAYYSALRRTGNNAALYVYPSGGHGFGFRENYSYHDQMLEQLSAWLKDLPSPKENAVRVACIGNSITDGSGIDMCETFGYPAHLQQMLGESHWVKNYGVGARTMLNKGDYPYMNEMAWQDALAFNPNIVVIKLGTNDSKPYNWKFGEEFEADMQQMVDALKQLPAKPRIMLCTPIKAFIDQWGINDSTIVNEIIPIIRRLATKNNLEVIDLHEKFNDADGRQMQRDGIHPTDKGASQMATYIYEVIVRK